MEVAVILGLDGKSSAPVSAETMECLDRHPFQQTIGIDARIGPNSAVRMVPP